MTTRGASGLVLHQHWQLMGALEAVAGMLMFGDWRSRAYVFSGASALLGRTHGKRSGNVMERQRELLISSLLADGLQTPLVGGSGFYPFVGTKLT